jgi:hypothetical protein
MFLRFTAIGAMAAVDDDTPQQPDELIGFGF